MTYAHLRIFNRPYLGRTFSAQPPHTTSMVPRFIFVKHLEPKHWWEWWLGSCIVQFFCKESPESKERKVYANLYLPDSNPNNKKYPLVIYTHGNGAVADEAANWLERIVESGFALLVCEYRGFGSAGGHPERKLINSDLCFFYDEALSTGFVDEKNITIYGRSLGGGIACDLAKKRSSQKLILESTYSTLKEISGVSFLPDYIFTGKDFECESLVKQYAGEVLICHGTNDHVSPVEQSKKLYSLNKNSQLCLFEASHSDIFLKEEYIEAVLKFIKK